MLSEEIKKFTPVVEEVIFDSLSRWQHGEFKDSTEYQIKTGGKRIRPFILWKFFKSLSGKEIEKALSAAAALEIFHNYSLIIDDIIDRGEVRRSLPTSRKKYGEKTSLCISSFYFSTIIDLLKDVDPSVSELMARKMKEVMIGELVDVLQERGKKVEPFLKKRSFDEIEMKDYFMMVEKKTAALFQAAAGSGLLLAKGKDLETALDFGKNLGISYQIQDDILDIFGDPEQFGKEKGKDIKEGKGGNIVLLLAAREDKSIAEKLEKGIDEKDLNEVILKIEETEAKKRAEKLSKKYSESALDNLSFLPAGNDKEDLQELVQIIAKRKK